MKNNMNEYIDNIIKLNTQYESFEKNDDNIDRHNTFISLLENIDELTKTITKSMPNSFTFKNISENMMVSYIKQKNKDVSEKMYDILEVLKIKNYTEENPLKTTNNDVYFYGEINNHFYICIDTSLRKYILFEHMLFQPYRYYPDLPQEECEEYDNWKKSVEDAKYLSMFSDNNGDNKTINRPNLNYFKEEMKKQYLNFVYSVEPLIKIIMTPTILNKYQEINLFFDATDTFFKHTK